MALPATDNFNRADANPIGGNWTTLDGFSALQIVSNRLTGNSGNSASFWNADSFSSDQYSQIVTSDRWDDFGPMVRCNNDGNGNGYYLYYGSGEIAIVKYLNGSNSTLASVAQAVSNGVIMKITVVGTTITGYIDGVQKIQTTDADIASGSPGVRIWNTNTDLDDWEGGNIQGATAKKCLSMIV